MSTALVGLGSNLGDRFRRLDAAVASLAAADLRVVGRSSWYETAPVGGPGDQDAFLNGAVLLETSLSPSALLERLQSVENAAGRTRSVPWGPRTLDLDLLLFDDRVIELPQLVVPHPRLAFRAFALRGAAEVAGDRVHPILRRSLSALRDHLRTAPALAAAIGADDGFRCQFVAEAAHVAGARLTEATDANIVAAAAELASRDGLTAARSLEFVAARRSAIERTVADAVGWTFDDAWQAAEIVTLAERLDATERDRLRAAMPDVVAAGRQPRLLVCLRRADEPRWAAVDAWRRRAAALGIDLVCPPTVDVVVSDREAAFVEIAAAVEAARDG